MRWLDRRWYAYLWARTPPDLKLGLAVAGVALLVVGGYYAATLPTGAAASSPSADAYIVRRTLSTRTVTVREHGRTRSVRVSVVRRVTLPAQAVTVRSLRTFTTQGGVRTVPVTRVKYVPVTRLRTRTVNHVVTSVVRRNGKTVTVVSTQPVTVELTVPVTVSQTATQTRVVTDESTVTRPVTTTQPVTVTLPPGTTTVVVTDQTTTTVVDTVTVPVTTTVGLTVTVP